MSEINHIAIIMDGNRRFSKRLMLEPWKGHEYGAKKVKEIMDWCKDHKIKILTLYAFSYENFNRPKKEYNYLMDLFLKEFDDVISQKDDINKKGLRINFIGRTELFSQKVQEKMKEIIDMTKNNGVFTVNFAMAYSGRMELVDAFKKMVKSGIKEEQIDEIKILENLYIDSEPELIVRTGGDKRLSNFLTFQGVYSELFFVDSLWPEFSKQQFDSIIDEFKNRERRFGI
jgi:tritrans,polycis-undecaprenyl-diphosphate synthase [geranylgeranyl-diphosphate specific]